jgi:glycosyltransferase involved in cell wall biosynthesis
MLYVFVNYNYSPGFHSPESWLERIKGYRGLMECLSEDNAVISIKQIDYEGWYPYNGVQHHFVNLNTRKTYFPRALNRYVKELKPDVVFIQGLHWPLQVVQLGALLNRKVKFIVQHHAEKPFTGLKKYLQRWADLHIDAYLFASKSMGMEWVKKGNLASKKKIHEVMEVSSVFYPVKTEEAKAKTNASGSPVFLWVGRLNQNKDPLLVIRAFLTFVKEQPSARLYMIYHTDELLAEVKELIASNTNKNAIVLIGKVPNPDLLYWYNSADFIVSGSHYEGSGTAVCEAMSCGCVPVVTDIFSFRMITDDGECGLLYEAGNDKALLAALLQTQQIDKAVKREKCLDYFKSTLSFQAIARRIQEVAASL